MALAGRIPLPGMARPHSLLYIPDIEPGLALKTLARLADHIAITSEDTRQYLPARSRVTVTGYPVRISLKSWSEDEARKILGLRTDLPVLLVTGGSKGARSINRATLNALPELLAEMQVIHVSGNLDWPEVENASQALTSRAGIMQEQINRYHPYPYLHEEMGAALMVANLVLSRSGASILGEYPQFGLPAVLVPYPHAWRYQWINARYLADKGAAIVIDDAELPTKLAPVVRDLMANPQRRNEMRVAMQALATPRAAETVAKLLWDLAKPEMHQRM
jgi:UDP-N-acetylglucosamine--N-acetylmuramyl-(pentapeptide) pyrophosphoryl-undecaprenol N-acetylglucosamine transferase